MYIYKTTNILNGKFYIGLSKFNPEDNPEYLGSGYILKRAIKKYGIGNFKKEILEECETKEKLLEQERYWIKLLSANHRGIGYNICEGGTWGDNFSHHPKREEWLRRLSEMNKGTGNPNYGNRWSQEQRDRAAKYCRDNQMWIDKKTGENYAKAPEIRKKISDSKIGLKNPHAKLWKLVSPTGEEHIIEGGIKREIKKYGIDYQQFMKRCKSCIVIDENTRQNKQGWKLIEMKDVNKNT